MIDIPHYLANAVQLMSEQVEWQLKHPHGSTEQLELHLKELYSSYL